MKIMEVTEVHKFFVRSCPELGMQEPGTRLHCPPGGVVPWQHIQEMGPPQPLVSMVASVDPLHGWGATGRGAARGGG